MLHTSLELTNHSASQRTETAQDLIRHSAQGFGFLRTCTLQRKKTANRSRQGSSKLQPVHRCRAISSQWRGSYGNRPPLGAGTHGPAAARPEEPHRGWKSSRPPRPRPPSPEVACAERRRRPAAVQDPGPPQLRARRPALLCCAPGDPAARRSPTSAEPPSHGHNPQKRASSVCQSDCHAEDQHKRKLHRASCHGPSWWTQEQQRLNPATWESCCCR